MQAELTEIKRAERIESTRDAALGHPPC
uniref:Uncharacterized protein n=1 Tax=Ralstonia solanacearum CFBP2957 TaxID=859656 RepID=D8P2B1_RALSL|nr:protein of unknown function [Ralstonia solanacearum CFBP2957]